MNPLAFLFAPRRVVASVALVFGLLASDVSPARAQNISTIAGTGTSGYSGDNGLATNAQLNFPVSVASDSLGNLYICDRTNHRIRKVAVNGTITTVAGTGTAGFSGDSGLATAATLSGPWGIAFDGGDNLYIADIGNRRIRKVNTAGIITTIAGNGSTTGSVTDGVQATTTRLGSPQDVALDSQGNFYIADTGFHRVRKVNTSGIISTVAGTGVADFTGDGGAATLARLNAPTGIALDGVGNLFIADFQNQRVRKVDTSGIINTIAGTGTAGFSGDGGAAISSQLYFPRGLFVDASFNLFIADTSNHRIRKVAPNGIITTVAGTGTAGFSGDGGLATSAQISGAQDVTLDAANNLFIADSSNHRVRKVTGAAYVPPALSVSDVAVAEGNIGTFNFNFSITLSPPSPQAVTVNYATANNSASAPGDYTTRSGSVTFNPGEYTKTIAVPVAGDTAVESSETFTLTLSSASGASLSDDQGIGTIINDDGTAAFNGRLVFAARSPENVNNFEIYSIKADGSERTRLTFQAANDVSPKLSFDGRRIVWASQRDGNREIYSMNIDGSEQTRLTNNAAIDERPDWSSDGTKIVFDSARDGNLEIYLMNADGSGQTRVTNYSGDDYAPAFHPNGAKIAWLSSGRDGGFDYEIYSMNLDGTGLTALTVNTETDGRPDWSPDGTRIAFQSMRTGESDVFVMQADGSNPVNLTPTSGGPSADNPAWSPDGTRIAFDTQSLLFAMNSDGTGETQISTLGGFQPSWGAVYVAPTPPTAPTSRIAFVSYESSSNVEIYVMNDDGSNITRVTKRDGGDVQPSLSATGQIVFVSSNDLYRIGVDGKNLTRLTNDGASNLHPSISADGSKIAFTSFRDGNFEIYTMNADGTGLVRLTNDAGIDWQPHLSADGSRIVFLSYRDNVQSGGVTRPEIYSINANGTGLTRLTNDVFQDAWPSWNPDATKIAFETFRNGNPTDIFVMNADGSAQTALTSSTNISDSSPSFSPDGSKIAFATSTAGNIDIHSMNANGSSVTRLTTRSAEDSDPSWASNGINTPPVAVDDRITQAFVTNGNTKTLLISASMLTTNDSDGENDTLTVTSVMPTANTFGTVTLNGGSISYEQSPGLKRLASFEYTVSDGRGGTDTGLVTVGEDQGLVVNTTSTFDGNEGLNTLRDAIEFANLTTGANTITFDIPTSDAGYNLSNGGTNVWTIMVGLSPLTDNGTTIDGASQTTNRGNTNAAGPEIRIEGGVPNALSIQASDCVIKSLILQGTSPSNGSPVTDSIVLIGGNVSGGGFANNNRIEGCYIGTNATGTGAAPTRAAHGVGLKATNQTTIGGATTDKRNTISGNLTSGIVLDGAFSTTVANNYIGTNAAGDAAFTSARQSVGVSVRGGSFGSSIGIVGAGNVISGNGIGVGVGLTPGSTMSTGVNATMVRANLIGLNAAGTLALGNSGEGVYLSNISNGQFGTSSNNTIGGSGAGEGNVISGNGNGIINFALSGTIIQGNKIGTDATGNLAFGNGGSGISVSLMSSGSGGFGGGSYHTLIGEDAGTSSTSVAGAGNLIANNNGSGIMVNSPPPMFGTALSTPVVIRRNSIYSNAGLGISLNFGTSSTPNDLGDTDSGANNLQNYPVISGVVAVTGGVTVSGTLNSTPSKQFALDFYSNTGGNEGRTWIGSATVNTDAGGNASFLATLTPAGGIAASNFITATATRLSGNDGTTGAQGDTSEFSATVSAIGATASGLIISEFRFRGTASRDQYVELYNTAGAPLNISGWFIRTDTGGGITQPSVVPAGTVVPAYGHFLFTGTGYSLSTYGASDASIGAIAADDSGVALFNAVGEVQDAAGFDTSLATLREGAGLASAPSGSSQHAFMRRFKGQSPVDTGDNAADFLLLTTDGAAVAGTSIAPQLGAPNPEGLTSPVNINAQIGVRVLDANFGPNAAPNRIRIGSGNGGSLVFRRIIKNNTGQPLNRIRLLITNITGQVSPVVAGQADVRVTSQADENVAVAGQGTVLVYGTTLEAPSNLSSGTSLGTVGGGGIGSSVNYDIVFSTPLQPNEERAYGFNVQVAKTGSFFVNINLLGK